MKIQSFPLSRLFSGKSLVTKILSWKKKTKSPQSYVLDFSKLLSMLENDSTKHYNLQRKTFDRRKHLYVIKNTFRFCSIPIWNPFCLIFRNSRRKLCEKKTSSIKVYFTSFNMALPWPRFWKRVPSLHVIGMAHHSSGIFFP